MKKKNKLARLLEKKDSIINDFEEISKVTVEDEDDEVFDLDYRCTDYGEAMNFFD